jgi:HD-GYP domain-containing protein (c-di-GMP phosphodiesterase class II)
MNEHPAATFMAALRKAASYQRLYGEGHALVTLACDDLAKAAERLAGSDRLTQLHIQHESLFLGGDVLPTTSLQFLGLIRLLRETGVTTMSLSPPVSSADAAALVALVSGSADEYAGGPTIAVNDEPIDGVDAEARPTDGLRGAYTASLDTLRHVGNTMRRGGRIDLRETSSAVGTLLEQTLAQPAAAVLLATIKSHHEYTFYHSVNTCILSLGLGRLAGLPPDDLVLLGMGALLHDIGKLGVSVSVLQHPGRLLPDQWEEIRRHPQIGATAILDAAGVGQEIAAAVAFEHHARYDGSGYPRLVYHDHTHPPPPTGHPLHFFSRLVAVADTYDAITTRRAYRKAEPPSRALHVLLTSAGTSYEADAVLGFIEMLGVYPPGSFLRLRNGAVVMVTHPAPGAGTAPRAVQVTDRSGHLLGVPEPVQFDLGDIGEQLTRDVVGLEPASVLSQIGEELPQAV